MEQQMQATETQHVEVNKSLLQKLPGSRKQHKAAARAGNCSLKEALRNKHAGGGAGSATTHGINRKEAAAFLKWAAWPLATAGSGALAQFSAWQAWQKAADPRKTQDQNRTLSCKMSIGQILFWDFFKVDLSAELRTWMVACVCARVCMWVIDRCNSQLQPVWFRAHPLVPKTFLPQW